ncbi:MAG: hypothetical protein MUD17_12760 [Gemmatimonadaceae bacterium]|jgi:hypothetical protein|nr:hypothetical protein [Gemmatimonadaceae bacterium]
MIDSTLSKTLLDSLRCIRVPSQFTGSYYWTLPVQTSRVSEGFAQFEPHIPLGLSHSAEQRLSIV